MKTIEMNLSVNLKELGNCLIDLPDETKVKFVVGLGEEGDLTYELKLLRELCKLIPKVYPLNSMNEGDELIPVVKSLLELKTQLTFLDNE
jgi:hypothetical protein